MLFFTILNTILFGIGVLLTAILFVPYSYQVSGEKLEETMFKGSVSWLFGGVKMSFRQQPKQKMEIVLTILGLNKNIKLPQKSARTKNTKNKEPIKNGKTGQSKKLSNFLKYIKGDLIKNAIALLLKILKHCRPKTLFVDAQIGFNDPMFTGLLCALNSQFSVLFNSYDISLQPVFDEEIIKGRFLIGGRIWLPYLILVMIGFLITKPFRNILITQLKMKIKGGLHYVR